MNINVTLLFSVERYEAVTEAYIRGLERRREQGQSVERIASVASFFHQSGGRSAGPVAGGQAS